MPKGKLDKIMQDLEDIKQRVSMIESNLPKREESFEKKEKDVLPMKQESFMEFFIKYKPKKDTDKTLVIMHFLESRWDMENITIKEISEGFKEVREKKPLNISDKLQLLHKKGLIMPSNPTSRLKSWMITRTGLNYLEKLKNGNKKT